MTIKKFKSLQSPQGLKKGDTVALIQPSSRLEQKLWTQSALALRQAGFCVASFADAQPQNWAPDSYFGSSDGDRAREWQWVFSQPGIRAVFSCRGGYGSQRMIAEFKNQFPQWQPSSPKIFMGYSDSTYLHQFIQNQWGWKTLHGPLIGFLEKNAITKLASQLIEIPNRPAILDLGRVTASKNSAKSSHPKARGRLVGGNLAMLQVAGFAQLPKVPMILAIEDVNENFYRVDRRLCELIDAGYADFVKGMILGTFKNCGKDDRSTFGWARVQTTLQKLCRGPIISGANFGHGLKLQSLLPLGSQVELSPSRLKVLEPFVNARAHP